MKENKEFKNNENYFKKGEALKFIGIGLIVLSAVLYFFGWGYISYILMCIGLPLGAVLFILSTLGRSSEADIDAYVKKHTQNVEHKTDDYKKFQKRFLKAIPTQTIEDYDFSEGLMYKKGKTGEIRSSRYCKAVIYPLDTGLCICFRKLSLVSDEVENNEIEIPYTEISVFEIKSEEKKLVCGKNIMKVKKASLMIGHSDGTVLSLPIQDNIKTEEFVKNINEQISSAKASE